MPDLETRHLKAQIEFRSVDGGPGVLEGYAAVFNRYSQNLGGFVEQVAPDAFNKSISDGVPVVARYNHDPNFLLGTTEANTLELQVDSTGLRYGVTLPNTSYARDLAVLAERRDVQYSSFAFNTMADEWSMTDQGFPLRTLQSVRLIDVAPVNDPAYRDTSVGLRSLASHLHVDESWIREASLDDMRSRFQISPEQRGEEVEDEQAAAQVDNHADDGIIARRLRELELMNKHP